MAIAAPIGSATLIALAVSACGGRVRVGVEEVEPSSEVEAAPPRMSTEAGERDAPSTEPRLEEPDPNDDDDAAEDDDGQDVMGE